MEVKEITTLYDMCYDSLYRVFDFLDTYYVDKKVDGKYKAMLDFLNGRSKQCDELVTNVTRYGTFSLPLMKKVMMLIVASTAYLDNLYEATKDINQELAEGIMNDLESRSPQEIIDLFKLEDTFARDIIYDAESYFYAPFTRHDICKSLLVQEGKVRIILKINPLALFDIYDYILEDDFLTSEVVLQMIFDAFDKTGEVTELDNNPDEDEDKDEKFVKLFLEYLEDKLSERVPSIDIIIQYLFANVYELIILMDAQAEDKKYYKWCLNLKSYLESTNPHEVIDRFYIDYNFASEVICLFIDYNDALDDGELFERHQEFLKKHGDTNILKDFNPFYDEEMQEMQRIREKENQ